MTYTLDPADLAGSVIETAHSQLHDAIEQLSDKHGEDPEKAVHEARKDIKKLRALLRLLRPVLDNRVRQTENAALRDAAGLISGARDADVMIATLESVREEAFARVPGLAIDHVEQLLQARSVEIRAQASSTIEPALAALRAADVRVEEWTPARVRRRDIVAGMTRTYADGRDALRAARKHRETDALHDWRKRVKDLWYEERLLAEVWPGVLDASAEQTKLLSELLGDDHDVAVLAEHLTSLPLVDGLAEVLDARRAHLQNEAFRLGARIYAEKPEAFAARIDAWLAAAIDEARSTAAA